MLFLDYQPELSPLDQDIYDTILNHIESVPKLKLKDLADLAHTSTTSITRFCKKFECQTFSEFKVKLKLYKDSIEKVSIADVDETQYIDFLERLNQPFLSNRLDQAVELLLNKKLVIFIGSGTSETIAEYGSLYFSNLSQAAVKIEDPSNYPIDWFPDEILEQSCIIALSISGETKELLHYLKRLKAKPAPVIAITNTEQSPVAKLADLTLPYFITRETIYKTSDNKDKTIELTSQLPAILLVEKLAKRLRLNKGL